jgi:hypothetical protein
MLKDLCCARTESEPSPIFQLQHKMNDNHFVNPSLECANIHICPL